MKLFSIPAPTTRRRVGALTVAAPVLIVGLLLAAPAMCRADAAQDDYDAAVALHKDKRWELSATQFQKFLRQNPNHEKAAFARLYLGLSLTNLGKYDDARTAYREFVRNHPQNRNLPDAMYRVAECSYLLDDLPAAETEFTAFLQKYPRHELVEWALPYLADTQLRQKKAEAAADNFQKSLELFPQGRMAEDARFGLARAYESKNDSARAIALYREIASDPTGSRAPQAQLNLAARYFDDGKYTEAAAAYRQLETKFADSPLVPLAQLNAGYAYYKLADFETAVTQFERAARDEKQAATARYWKGLSLKPLGRFDEASKALQSTFEADPESPLAADALFQWADSQLRAGEYEAARDRFLDFVRRWPEKELAADSLHYAGEASLRTGDHQRTQQLIDRFRRDYPDNRLRMHNELLQARLDDARGNPQQAIEGFRKVLDESNLPATRNRARFHLARTLQKQDDHKTAAEILAPLVEAVRADGSRSEFIDALVLQGISLAATGQHEPAVRHFTEYLKLVPGGSQAEQALAGRAISEARLGNWKNADADLAELARSFPKSEIFLARMHQVAEIAYEAKSYTEAADWFGRLAKRGPESPFHAAGLSGLGWSRFQQKQFADAASAFEQLIAEHPQDPLAAEAAFKRAESLDRAATTVDQRKSAAEAYAAAFRQLAPQEAAPEKADESGPTRYAYLAGLEAARAYRKLDQIDEADAAYDRLTKTFPKSREHDLLLDEWAVMHYEAEEFEKADDLFRRLVRDFPKSSRADDARLNLAESDYIAGRLDLARQAFRTLTENPDVAPVVDQRSLYNLVKIGVEQRDWKAVKTAAEQFNSRYPREKFTELAYRPHIGLLLGEALVNLEEYAAAEKSLSSVKSDPASAAADWYPRVYVLLAEANVRQKNYEAVATLAAEFRERDPESPLLHQVDEILGRSLKNQAKFNEARKVFERVVEDPHGRRTETAAKSQFMIAETYLLQKDYKSAQAEYYKVYHLYKFPEWQAYALLQAGKCDESLGQWKEAATVYEDLLRQFPESKPAADAKLLLPQVRRRAAG